MDAPTYWLMLGSGRMIVGSGADVPVRTRVPETVADGARLVEIYRGIRFFEGPTWNPRGGKLDFTASSRPPEHEGPRRGTAECQGAVTRVPSPSAGGDQPARQARARKGSVEEVVPEDRLGQLLADDLTAQGDQVVIREIARAIRPTPRNIQLF